MRLVKQNAFLGHQLIHQIGNNERAGADPTCRSHLQNLGQDSGSEERCMLDDNEVAFILVRDFELIEDGVCWLSDNHCAEQLAAQPCATAWGNPLLDDGHLDPTHMPALASAFGTAMTLLT